MCNDETLEKGWKRYGREMLLPAVARMEARHAIVATDGDEKYNASVEAISVLSVG
jgi:hypothetical protein